MQVLLARWGPLDMAPAWVVQQQVASPLSTPLLPQQLQATVPLALLVLVLPHSAPPLLLLPPSAAAPHGPAAAQGQALGPAAALAAAALGQTALAPPP